MITLKTPKEIAKMRIAGKILSDTAKELLAQTKIGVNIKDLDDLARQLILKAGAKPAFLGYQPYGAKKPYPCTICASVNEVIVHGIPKIYILKSGDVLKIDIGVVHEGYYADAAWTIGIGKISPQTQKLISVTQKALDLAIKECRPDTTLGDIGFIINDFVSANGFKVVKGLTGHGIGTKLHDDPNVYNEGRRGVGIALRPGMTLAIEPMVAIGTNQIKQLPNDSFATADGSLSAHFEHTVLITKNEPEILTI